MSLAAHAHDHTHNRVDPTGTLTLRRKYAAELYKRFRTIKGLVYRGVGVEDRLRLAAFAHDDLPHTPDIPEGALPPTAVPGDEEAYAQFIEWLKTSHENIILSPVSPTGSFWGDEFVFWSYEKGAQDGAERLAQAGAVDDASRLLLSLDLPVHQRMIALLMQNNLGALEGITAETEKQVGQILADAFVEGVNPRVAARRINERIDAIGITRARTHARTSMIKTYNEAALTRYEQVLGPEGEVTARVEFRTAGDNRVCPICLDLEGQVFTVKEARGVIPVHPRCRCTWLPLTR